MRKLIGGGLVALAIALAMAPVAGAEPDNDCADPNGACHEFDWAIPYYDAFERHGITYIADREGIPLMEAVDTMCRGEKSELWNYVELTPTEGRWVVEAARDVCPEVVG